MSWQASVHVSGTKAEILFICQAGISLQRLTKLLYGCSSSNIIIWGFFKLQLKSECIIKKPANSFNKYKIYILMYWHLAKYFIKNKWVSGTSRKKKKKSLSPKDSQATPKKIEKYQCHFNRQLGLGRWGYCLYWTGSKTHRIVES